MPLRFCDELPFGFGWIEDGFLRRCSHALVVAGAVWIVDPIDGDGVDERIRAAGAPAGVIQLLDRHRRDCEAFAQRFGVPLHCVPRAPLAGAPFDFLPVRDSRIWAEVALWWPEPAVLVCADALGTVPSHRVHGELLGLHPLLRLRPPRRLADAAPRHVLCGHGEGVHGDAAAPAVREALVTARRRLPRAWAQGVAAVVRGWSSRRRSRRARPRATRSRSRGRGSGSPRPPRTSR